MSSASTTVSFSPLLSASRPFPGLRPFEEADADWFFGRSSEINDLLKRLRRVRFVAVVGPSGCGKSSLIKAGILPSIRDGYLDVEWSIATFRPGEQPLDNLARAVSAAISVDFAELRKTLDSGSMGLVRAVQSQPLGSDRKLLILVDQFEELFQFAQRHGDEVQEEVKAFLKLLLNAVTAGDAAAYVVLTMRMEWLSECATYVGLAEAINEGIYLVPQMSRRQFQQVILGPIEAAHGTITAVLVDRMLNDLGGKSDQLPILQHALMRLWERPQDGEPLEIADYEKIGTLSRCLSAHAEEVYSGLNEAQKHIAEVLFRSITQVYKNRKVRRPRPFRELANHPGVDSTQLKVVIEAFGRQGRSFLFTTEGPVEPSSVVDISHEALMRQWGRLGGWVENEAEIQSRVGRLEEDAEEWDRGKRKDRSVLYSGYKLQRADELTSRLETSGTALRFLKASHRAQRWRRIWLRGSLALVSILIAGSLIYVQRLRWQARVVELDRDRAQAAEQANLAREGAMTAQENVAIVTQQAIRDQQLLAKQPLAKNKRIYMQYVSDDQRELVKNVQDYFRKQHYLMPGSGERVSASKSPHDNQVRYFNKGDDGDAGTIASLLAPLVTGRVVIQPTNNPNGVVPVGQFEIWLAEGTTTATP
jgi:energy-coupling factor transporter ATP-binding protein EcfA2